VLHVGDDAHLRLRDGAQLGELTEGLHAHLEDGEWCSSSDAQQRQRQADLGV